MLGTRAILTKQAAAVELNSNAVPSVNVCQAVKKTAKTACGAVATVAGADIKTIRV
jgi:hypothetical protein